MSKSSGHFDIKGLLPCEGEVTPPRDWLPWQCWIWQPWCPYRGEPKPFVIVQLNHGTAIGSVHVTSKEVRYKRAGFGKTKVKPRGLSIIKWVWGPWNRKISSLTLQKSFTTEIWRKRVKIKGQVRGTSKTSTLKWIQCQQFLAWRFWLDNGNLG